jgi:hypothetical protein
MYMKYLHIFSNTSILVDYCFPDVRIFSNTDGNAASFRKDFLVIFCLHKTGSLGSHNAFMAPYYSSV